MTVDMRHVALTKIATPSSVLWLVRPHIERKWTTHRKSYRNRGDITSQKEDHNPRMQTPTHQDFWATLDHLIGKAESLPVTIPTAY